MIWKTLYTSSTSAAQLPPAMWATSSSKWFLSFFRFLSKQRVDLKTSKQKRETTCGSISSMSVSRMNNKRRLLDCKSKIHCSQTSWMYVFSLLFVFFCQKIHRLQLICRLCGTLQSLAKAFRLEVSWSNLFNAYADILSSSLYLLFFFSFFFSIFDTRTTDSDDKRNS